jgi:hypothetical protein
MARRLFAALIVALSSLALDAQATTYYVDGELGNNVYDGLTSVVLSSTNGPKLDIGSAITAASSGDSIVVAAGFCNEVLWDTGAKSLTLLPQGQVTIITQVDSVGDGIPDWWRRHYFGGSGTTTDSTSCASCDPDGDGLPNAWEFQYVLNPLNSGDATNDLDSDGYSNFDELLMGTSPATANDPITVYVDSMNTNGVWEGTPTHPFRYIQDAIECSAPLSSNLAVRARPGTYYETVSNQHYDFDGNVLTNRPFVYLYAANNDWSLSTDPETHIIDSSGLPNGDTLGNPNATLAPAVEFFDVARARVNGFTIRGGKGFYGGGILAYSSMDGPIYISNCIVEKNGGSGSEAGGIFIQAGTSSLIYNTVITKNSGAAGGIVDVFGSRLWNCTVVSNYNIQSDVGAIIGLNAPTSLPNVRNCAVWGNGLDLTFVNADYSTFGSNQFSTVGTHNLTNDPILVNTAFGNYRLQTNSPVIGAGTSLPIEQRDLYGNSRSAGGSVDIGANQYTDSDGDGMQDDWETKRGLNPGSGGDAGTNLDTDSFNNLDEYNHNTDPHNSDTDGDGFQDDQDPDPATPDLVLTIEFHSYYRDAVWQYYINGVTDPSWLNQPPTEPRVIKLKNYHIGDELSLQSRYLSGPVGDPLFFLVPLQSKGAFSVLPAPDATPLLHFTDSAPPGQLTPPGGWLATAWTVILTNTAGPCAGFDDETPKFFNFTHRALSVPNNGTNTVTADIFPTNLYGQVTFETGDSFISVSPTQATSATQLLQVSGTTTGTNIASSYFLAVGNGAQDSDHPVGAIADVDVLPKKTNVFVFLYRAIATSNSPPTNVPSESDLKAYLDGLYGKQANVYMTVAYIGSLTNNYDLNGNGALDWSTNSLTAEQIAIMNAFYVTGAINVYYVNALTNSQGRVAEGITFASLQTCFIQDAHTNTSVNITAHEIGHALGILAHPNDPGRPLTGDPDRLMWAYDTGGNPCRLIRSEWQTVNKRAQ